MLRSDRSWAEQRLRRSEVTTRTQCHQGQRQTPSWRLRCPHGSLARLTDCSQPLHFGGYLGSRLRLRCPDSTVLPPDSSQTALTTTAQIHLFYFFLKKKKKGKDPTKQQKQGSCPAPMGAGHASGWAGRSTPPGGCGLSNTSLGVGGANRGEVQRRRVSQQSQRKVHGRAGLALLPRPGRRGSAQDCEVNGRLCPLPTVRGGGAGPQSLLSVSQSPPEIPGGRGRGGAEAWPQPSWARCPPED